MDKHKKSSVILSGGLVGFPRPESKDLIESIRVASKWQILNTCEPNTEMDSISCPPELYAQSVETYTGSSLQLGPVKSQTFAYI